MRPTPILICLAFICTAAETIGAQSALRAAPSGRATSEVALTYPRGHELAGSGPVTIRVDYGQPHLRGRSLHTDSLVPYDEPWRTGANASTTLTTGVDLVIGDRPVPAGSYVVFTMPRQSGWELILQREAGQEPAEYLPANDVARIDLRRRSLSTPIESLSISLIPSTQPGPARGELRLAWGTVELSTDWSVADQARF